MKFEENTKKVEEKYITKTQEINQLNKKLKSVQKKLDLKDLKTLNFKNQTEKKMLLLNPWENFEIENKLTEIHDIAKLSWLKSVPRSKWFPKR